jgi:hypothetical protein
VRLQGVRVEHVFSLQAGLKTVKQAMQIRFNVVENRIAFV